MDETPRGQDDSALGAWRRTLKQLNTNPPPFSGSKKLDGSIKKNSAFVKKLRGPLSAETLPGLKREMDGLTLEKYLAELIGALTETRFKSASDAQAGADLISSLHQRFYPDFSKDLMPALYRAFSTAVPTYPPDLSSELVEKEETARIGRLRSALRLVIELYLVGLFHPKFKEASLSLVLKELVNMSC